MSEIKKILVTTWSGNGSLWAMDPVVLGSVSGGRNVFGEKKFQNIFSKKIFPGIFKWFCLHKKVCLTTLGPSERLSGVRHGLSQAQVACKTAFLANFGQFRGIWCQKIHFFPFLGLKIIY